MASRSWGVNSKGRVPKVHSTGERKLQQHTCMDVQIPIRRFKEVAEEYGMTTVYVGEAYSSTTCPVHRDRKCVKRVKRGLLKCTLLNKVFNADLVGAYNILITPSPEKGRGNGPKTRPGATFSVAPNLPALTGGTLAP